MFYKGFLSVGMVESGIMLASLCQEDEGRCKGHGDHIHDNE